MLEQPRGRPRIRAPGAPGLVGCPACPCAVGSWPSRAHLPRPPWRRRRPGRSPRRGPTPRQPEWPWLRPGPALGARPRGHGRSAPGRGAAGWPAARRRAVAAPASWRASLARPRPAASPANSFIVSATSRSEPSARCRAMASARCPRAVAASPVAQATSARLTSAYGSIVLTSCARRIVALSSNRPRAAGSAPCAKSTSPRPRVAPATPTPMEPPPDGEGLQVQRPRLASSPWARRMWPRRLSTPATSSRFPVSRYRARLASRWRTASRRPPDRGPGARAGGAPPRPPPRAPPAPPARGPRPGGSRPSLPRRPRGPGGRAGPASGRRRRCRRAGGPPPGPRPGPSSASGSLLVSALPAGEHGDNSTIRGSETPSLRRRPGRPSRASVASRASRAWPRTCQYDCSAAASRTPRAPRSAPGSRHQRSAARKSSCSGPPAGRATQRAAGPAFAEIGMARLDADEVVRVALPLHAPARLPPASASRPRRTPAPSPAAGSASPRRSRSADHQRLVHQARQQVEHVAGRPSRRRRRPPRPPPASSRRRRPTAGRSSARSGSESRS